MTSQAKFLSNKTGIQGARLPDPPEEPRMIQNRYLHHTGVSATLAHYFGALDEGSSTLVEGAGYLCRNATDLPNCPYPGPAHRFRGHQRSRNKEFQRVRNQSSRQATRFRS